MGIRLRVANLQGNLIDFTQYADFERIRIQHSQERKGAVMTFTLTFRGNPIAPPSAGAEVVLEDTYTEYVDSGGNVRHRDAVGVTEQEVTIREFGGVIINRGIARVEADVLMYTYSCQDYSFYLDRRYLNSTYPDGILENLSAERFYPSAMFLEILNDLKTAADNDGAGDAHYNYMVDAANTLGIRTSVAAIRSIQASRQLPSQVFTQIADASGQAWFIDSYKRVRLYYVLDEDAPLALQRSNPTYPSELFPTLDTRKVDPSSYESQLQYFDWEEEEDVTGVGTKCIVQNTRIQSLHEYTDSFLWSPDNRSTLFNMTRRPFSEIDVSVVSVTTSNGNITIYTKRLEDVSGELGDADPTSGEVFVYVGNLDSNEAYVRFGIDDLTSKYNSTANPVGGNPVDVSSSDFTPIAGRRPPITVKVTYRYAILDDREGLDPSAVAEMAARTGGDGIHEYVMSRASDVTLTSQEHADAVVDVLLGLKAAPIIRGHFSSHRKGWFPGQHFIRLSPVDPPKRMFVVNVEKTIETPDEVEEGYSTGPRVVSMIEYSTIPGNLSQ